MRLPFLILITLTLAIAQENPVQWMRDAQKGYLDFRDALPADAVALNPSPSDCSEPPGLSPDRIPLQVLDYAALEQWSPLIPSSTIFRELGQWLIPVKVCDHLLGFFQVTQSPQGKLVPLSLGLAPLATEITQVLAAWPPADGFSLLLALDPRTRSFFFQIPQAPQPNLTALTPQPAQVDSLQPAPYQKLTPLTTQSTRLIGEAAEDAQ